MALDAKLKQEKKLVEDFKSLATAYQELSLQQMQLTRNTILKSREFLEELSDVFFDVKMSYANILTLLIQQNQKSVIKQFAGTPKNGKQIDVLITANTKLYGSIVTKIFESFYQDLQKHKSDIFIIGRIGRQLFDAKKTDKQYAYFEINDDRATTESMAPIITYLLPYERVVVYYAKYINVLTQEPFSHNISGDKPPEKEEKVDHPFTFLFEPQLKNILHFFQTQAFSSFFNQSVHEGELARHASRITSMEEALKNIQIVVGQIAIDERRMKADNNNKKQLQQLAGISLWKK